MTEFEDIRPYHDDEVKDVLARVIQNKEFLDLLSGFVFSSWPALAKPVGRFLLVRKLKSEAKKISDVRSFQQLVEHYMQSMIDKATSGYTVSGIENLNDKSHLYLSNHRDIAMDPAFINLALFHNGRDTVRIAIGDNLLTKDFASDLMRLNKSFIVKRSLSGPREMMKAFKQLSGYIRFSVVEEKHDVWMAQREGRAKNSIDKTEPAIIKMLSMCKTKQESFSDVIGSLNIVPVSISYEWDPCDLLKAHELHEIETNGFYEKAEHEDVQSIGLGIRGEKGRVHISFGEEIAVIDDPEYVAAEIDRQIQGNYVLMPSNFFAWQKKYGKFPNLACGPDNQVFSEQKFATEKKEFERRFNQCPQEYQKNWLDIYANPVDSKLKYN